MLPSRHRTNGLLKAVESVFATADDPSRVEVLIAIDSDDDETIKRLGEFHKYPNTSITIARRDGVEVLMSRMAQIAKGSWLMMFNDDASIEGQGWDTQLAQFQNTDTVCQPETYRLGESRYLHAIKTGFPWFPNKCWEKLGCQGNFLPHPADYAVVELAQERRWKIGFLKGITIFHDRHE